MVKVLITDSTRIAIAYGTNRHKIYSTVERAKEGFDRSPQLDQAVAMAIVELEQRCLLGEQMIDGVWADMPLTIAMLS